MENTAIIPDDNYKIYKFIRTLSKEQIEFYREVKKIQMEQDSENFLENLISDFEIRNSRKSSSLFSQVLCWLNELKKYEKQLGVDLGYYLMPGLYKTKKDYREDDFFLTKSA